MSELTVLGCTLQAYLDTGVGAITVPSITVSNQPSDKNFHTTEGVDKGIYFDKITAVLSAGTFVTLTSSPAGASSPVSQGLTVAESVDIDGTADKILDSSNNKAVQKNDKGNKNITFMFLNTSDPPEYTIPYSVKVTVEVTDAGQTDIEAL